MMILETLISYLMIIVGWITVHILSKKRDIDKERRAYLKDYIVKIHQLKDLAFKYHTLDERDLDLERRIKFDIMYLEQELNIIKKYNNIKLHFYPLRNAITYNNFQSIQFKKQDMHSEIIYNIE